MLYLTLQIGWSRWKELARWLELVGSLPNASMLPPGGIVAKRIQSIAHRYFENCAYGRVDPTWMYEEERAVIRTLLRFGKLPNPDTGAVEDWEEFRLVSGVYCESDLSLFLMFFSDGRNPYSHLH